MNCIRPTPVDQTPCGVAIGGPPAPCPRPDLGGGGVIIVPGDPAGSLPTGAAPLPESGEPTIDFGSDAPVIRGDDGSVIEGGEIGEAYDPPGDSGPGGYDDGGFGDPGGFPDYYDDGGAGYDDGGWGGGGDHDPEYAAYNYAMELS